MSLPDKTSSEAGANIGQRAEGNTNIYEALDAQCRVKLCGARQYKQDGAWCMVLCVCACGAMTYNLEASLGAHLILEPHIFLKGALIIYAQYSVMGEEKFHYQWVGGASFSCKSLVNPSKISLLFSNPTGLSPLSPIVFR